MKVEIGTVLSFNESGFVMAIRAWEKLLIPINDALNFYNSLDIDLADQEVYDHIVNGRIEKLRIKYRSAIDVQLKRDKVSAFAAIEISSNCDNQIKILGQKIDQINSAINILPVDLLGFDYAVLATGLAVISKEGKEKLRNHFSVKIQNEKQVEFFGLVKALSETYEKVREYWNQNSSNPIDDSREMIGSDHNHFITEIDNKLVFDQSFLNMIGSKAKELILPKAPKQLTEAEMFTPTEQELAAAKERGPRVGDQDTYLTPITRLVANY